MGRRMAVALVLTLAVAAAHAAPAPEPALHPGVGIFLVADETLRDPSFARSVVLLLEADDEGAFGLVINRPMPLTLADLLAERSGAVAETIEVFSGGPVETGRVALLFRDPVPRSGSNPVVGDVQITFSRTTLEQLLATPDADAISVRAFAGYAGWSAGQLEGEVARGDWHLMHASAESIFAPEPLGLWQQLIRRLAGTWVQAPEVPGVRPGSMSAAMPEGGQAAAPCRDHEHGAATAVDGVARRSIPLAFGLDCEQAAVGIDLYHDPHRVAADTAVLDVVLVAGGEIQLQLGGRPAPRTHDLRFFQHDYLPFFDRAGATSGLYVRPTIPGGSVDGP